MNTLFGPVGVGVLCYLGISQVFFRFPSLLRKKKQYKCEKFNQILNQKKVLHISHRGGSRENVENTMEAFKHAAKLGTDMLEMDVCLTKDKQIVVLHDSVISRLTGVKEHISKFNYDEIPPHLPLFELHFADKNNRMFDSTKGKSPYFPLLEEVFKEFPNMLINIEMKDADKDESIIQRTNDLIKKYNREHLTIWGTRHIVQTELAMKTNPNIPTFFSLERILITYLYFILGVLPFVNIKENSMQIPLRTNEFKNWKLEVEKSVFRRMGIHFFFGFMGFLNFISLPLFEHLKKRGVLVIYWVINEPEDMARAARSGAVGIMTDCPTLLKQYLDKSQMSI